MAADYHQPISRVLALRTRSAALLATEEVGSEVHNWRLLEDGTLRALKRPVELVPRYVSSVDPLPGWKQVVDYGDPLGMLGLFHARLDDRSSREILLAHFDGAVRVFTGYWAHYSGVLWLPLIGPGGLVDVPLSVTGLRPSRLTGFVATPQGVVILVEGLRPYIYDGEFVRPFGFMTRPAPPKPLHPQGSVGDGTLTGSGASATGLATNSQGYSYTGRTIPGALGTGRFGTVDTTVVGAPDQTIRRTNTLGGALLQTEHSFRLQFVDHFANLSALSDVSAVASCNAETNLEKAAADANERADRMRWSSLLTSIAVGPPGTEGRIVGMTRDLKSSGDPKHYNIISNLGGANFGFATIPDNDCRIMPLNVSSDWLQQEMLDVEPMPLLDHGALAMGRFWGASGARLLGSHPGRYGTMDPKMVIIPDARGSLITGMVTVPEGLLVLTSRSTYLVEPNDAGEGVRARTLHPDVGTLAPGSLQTHPSGVAFWRSTARTFHAYSAGKVTPLQLEDINDILSRVNRSWQARTTSAMDPISGAYRCWIAIDGSKQNNIGLEFDGNGWRTRDDIYVQAACNMDGADKLSAALGHVPTVHPTTGVALAGANSLFAIDHAGLWTREIDLDADHLAEEAPAPLEAIVATTWLRTTRSYRKGSPTRIILWLGETSSGTWTVEAGRDGRNVPLAQELLAADSRALACHPVADESFFYDAVLMGSTHDYKNYKNPRLAVLRDSARMRTRRRYSAKVDLEIPSVETFKVKLRVWGDANFVAIAYQENTAPWHGGATMDVGAGPE